MGILDFLSKRRAKRTFSSYVGKEVIDLLNRDPKDLPRDPLEKKRIQFIIVNIDDSDGGPNEKAFEQVVQLCYQHRATNALNSPALVVFVMGFPYSEPNNKSARMALANGLLSELGAKVRIAHGECEGFTGIIGPSRYPHFGTFIPEFTGKLERLIVQPFGTAIEIPPSPGEKQMGGAEAPPS